MFTPSLLPLMLRWATHLPYSCLSFPPGATWACQPAVLAEMILDTYEPPAHK